MGFLRRRGPGGESEPTIAQTGGSVGASTPLRDRLWWIYLAAGSAGCGAYCLMPGLRASGVAYCGFGLLGTGAVGLGLRIHRPRARGAWCCFLAGLALNWAGDVYVHEGPRLLGIHLHFPSPASALYLAVDPALMVGLLILARSRRGRRDGPGTVDAIILSLGLALVWFVVLIAPDLHGHAIGRLTRLVTIGYPAGDIVLLAAAVRLALDAGERRPAFHLILASILAVLVTDFAFGVLAQRGDYHGQPVVEVGWILFYLLWGAGALHPSMRGLSNPGPDRGQRLTPMRFGLLGGATLIAPVVEAVTLHVAHRPDLLVPVGASIVLVVLVVSRLAGLVRERERGVQRERLLATAGGELVAATSVEAIAEAGLRAAVALGGSGVTALLCRETEGDLHVHAVPEADRSRSFLVAREVADVLRHLAPEAAPRLGGWVIAQLGLASECRRATVLELSFGSGDGIWLLLAGPRATDLETRSSLTMLASQVSMALEGAELREQVLRRASESRLSSLVQNSSDLITILDGAGTITYQSPSIAAVLGYTSGAVIGGPFAELLHPDERESFRRRFADGAGAGSEPVEWQLVGDDGAAHPFEVLITDMRDDEQVRGIVLNGRDVSERKALEEELARQAFHDAVTHLPNRALFNERVRHAVARSRREEVGLATIFVDLDDFKTINDSLGHAAGDGVLLEVARRLDACVRAGDTPARFGGDEFAILLEDVADVQIAAETAERILQALGAPLTVEHKTLTVRASLGISFAEPGAPSSAEELVRNADAAMYIAKADGKDGYRVFEPAMHEQVLSRLELRGELQRALVDREFELHYQPLVRLADGAVTGVEALLRWHHPERGMVAPDEFIPFAEETGLIIPIGRWVLREGCRRAKALGELAGTGPRPGVAVNLSVRQLLHPEILDDVLDALAAVELEPGALTLEITESVMMHDTEIAARRLTELREVGVRIALDDFGTGYSSLSYLSRFPLDVLKMDRSLLAAGSAPATSGLASAVLGLGETFGLEVVAEGIEHPEQLATLRGLGCATGQGFLFARPMPAHELEAFLARPMPFTLGEPA